MASVSSPPSVFDVGIADRLAWYEYVPYGVQHILGMTGMFLFPGILGAVLHLPPAQIGYLYGVTFITSGIVTLLQSAWLLRLPIVQGPYAGTFAALLVAGHLAGLGRSFGSLAVAALIWCLLALPIRRLGLVGAFARHVSTPLVYGSILLIIMTQLTNVALPAWVGDAKSPGFPGVNLLAGGVAIAVMLLFMLGGRGMARRGSVLWGVIAGALCYALFIPIKLDAVARAPLLAPPQLFPFGFGVDAGLVLVFFLTLLPAIAESIALYYVVAEWGGEPMPPERVNGGIFGEALGTAIGAVFGGIATITYPDNVGMLRATRVGSRYVTLGAGLILIILGSIVKFDLLLVAIPQPVLAAAGTLLFGVIAMSAVQMLGKVEWDEINLVVGGFSFMAAIGTLFIPAAALEHAPLALRTAVTQPLLVGTVLVLLLHGVLNVWWRPRRAGRAAAARPAVAGR